MNKLKIFEIIMPIFFSGVVAFYAFSNYHLTANIKEAQERKENLTVYNVIKLTQLETKNIMIKSIVYHEVDFDSYKLSKTKNNIFLPDIKYINDYYTKLFTTALISDTIIYRIISQYNKIIEDINIYNVNLMFFEQNNDVYDSKILERNLEIIYEDAQKLLRFLIQIVGNKNENITVVISALPFKITSKLKNKRMINIMDNDLEKKMMEEILKFI